VSNRTNIVAAVIGARGTGKTTLLKGDPSIKVPGILPQIMRKRPGQKILIVDTFDNPIWRDYSEITAQELPVWQTGPRRMFNSDVDRSLELVNTYCYNTIVVFEDATKFIKGKLNPDLEKFIYDTKQRNVDLYFVFHYLAAAPPGLSRAVDWLILFKTMEKYNNQIAHKWPQPQIEYDMLEIKNNPDKYFNKAIDLRG